MTIFDSIQCVLVISLQTGVEEREERVDLKTGVVDSTFADTMVMDEEESPGASITTKPSQTEADGFHGNNLLSHDAVVDAAPHARRRQFSWYGWGQSRTS